MLKFLEASAVNLLSYHNKYIYIKWVTCKTEGSVCACACVCLRACYKLCSCEDSC